MYVCYNTGPTLVMIDANGHYSSFQLLQTLNDTKSPAARARQHFQQPIPFNPTLACALAIGYGARGECLVEFINSTLPMVAHDDMGTMLLRRGLVFEGI